MALEYAIMRRSLGAAVNRTPAPYRSHAFEVSYSLRLVFEPL